MPRIRTIKPEAFTSESLAEVRVEAERTFFGLLTQADDRGRHRDNAAVVAGALWPLRPEHTAVHVEEDLRQLAAAKLVCRYTGCDGKRYLHFPTWNDHQKINKPSESRQPICREHEPDGKCGHCKKTDCPSKRSFPEGSGSPTGGIREGSNQSETDTPTTPRGLHGGAPITAQAPAGAEEQVVEGKSEAWEEAAGHSPAETGSGNTPGILPDSSSSPQVPDLGPRNVDLGSSAYGGAAHATRDTAEPITAQTIVSEWLDRVRKRPPGSVIGRVGKQVKKLLDEGIDPDDVRSGMARWMAKGADPSTIPSFVNQAMNAASPASAAPAGNVLAFPGQPRPSTTDQRVAQALALAAELRAQEGTPS
jgi:hypothetical protein